MTGLIADMAGPILTFLAIVGGLFAAWFAGKAKGNATAKVEAAEQRTEDNNAIAAETIKKNQKAIAEQNEATVQANEIDEAVSRMSDADVLNELHNGAGTAETNRNNGDKK